jgi:class 3 adenylate cyclase/predicted transcriptional regulator YheO
METGLLTALIILLPVLFIAGYFTGKRTIKDSIKPKRIEEYEFYPFITNEQGIVEFSQPLFNEAVRYLVKNKNPFASKQLIIIGEQNIVRDILSTNDLNNYLLLYNKYDGQKLLSENDQFMENYKRIVTLIGKSFKGTGMEILLHNLVNPTKSVIAIENGEVTGRKIENGTTNLLLDLKTRKQQNQDKLNYELRIGSRLFKCTTIPIFRRDYGLVGAICINVDSNFIKNEVMSKKEKLEAFIANIVKTDFQLNENILSKEEYKAAMAGKKHFADDVLLSGQPFNRNNRLMAILFSDIVNYSSLMGKDEKQALKILDENRKIHRDSMTNNNGTLLKEIGDGILASFNSVSDAVFCGINIQKNVKQSNNYQLRIGIHLGEVFTSDNDVFGDGVNIASRIQSVALPGTVAISEVVYDNIKNKIGEEVLFAGEKQLKNIDGLIKIYQVSIPQE